MKNGHHVYFTVQWRLRGQSRWGHPKGRLKSIPHDKRDEWSNAGGSFWAGSLNPRSLSSEPRYPEADRQFRKCQDDTGVGGWFEEKYAIAAIKRLIRDDRRGKYDNPNRQKVRHEFRLVKCELTYQLRTTTINPRLKSK